MKNPNYYIQRIRCKWCGEIIHFEPHLHGNNGKEIPLNYDNSIHHCLNSKPILSTKNRNYLQTR
jgi:hypothetical protein